MKRFSLFLLILVSMLFTACNWNIKQNEKTAAGYVSISLCEQRTIAPEWNIFSVDKWEFTFTNENNEVVKCSEVAQSDNPAAVKNILIPVGTYSVTAKGLHFDSQNGVYRTFLCGGSNSNFTIEENKTTTITVFVGLPQENICPGFQYTVYLDSIDEINSVEANLESLTDDTAAPVELNVTINEENKSIEIEKENIPSGFYKLTILYTKEGYEYKYRLDIGDSIVQLTDITNTSGECSVSLNKATPVFYVTYDSEVDEDNNGMTRDKPINIYDALSEISQRDDFETAAFNIIGENIPSYLSLDISNNIATGKTVTFDKYDVIILPDGTVALADQAYSYVVSFSYSNTDSTLPKTAKAYLGNGYYEGCRFRVSDGVSLDFGQVIASGSVSAYVSINDNNFENYLLNPVVEYSTENENFSVYLNNKDDENISNVFENKYVDDVLYSKVYTKAELPDSQTAVITAEYNENALESGKYFAQSDAETVSFSVESEASTIKWIYSQSNYNTYMNDDYIIGNGAEIEVKLADLPSNPEIYCLIFNEDGSISECGVFTLKTSLEGLYLDSVNGYFAYFTPDQLKIGRGLFMTDEENRQGFAKRKGYESYSDIDYDSEDYWAGVYLADNPVFAPDYTGSYIIDSSLSIKKIISDAEVSSGCVYSITDDVLTYTLSNGTELTLSKYNSLVDLDYCFSYNAVSYYVVNDVETSSTTYESGAQFNNLPDAVVAVNDQNPNTGSILFIEKDIVPETAEGCGDNSKSYVSFTSGVYISGKKNATENYTIDTSNVHLRVFDVQLGYYGGKLLYTTNINLIGSDISDENTSYLGGVIYCKRENGSSCSYHIGEGTTITGGTATKGGGIAINDNSSNYSLYIHKNAEITGNVATPRGTVSDTGLGGGIYIQYSQIYVYMEEGAKITNNTAYVGGGLYSGWLTSSATITGNTATNYGGGIYNYYRFNIKGGEISGNSDGVYCKYGSNSNWTIADNVFGENTGNNIICQASESELAGLFTNLESSETDYKVIISSLHNMDSSYSYLLDDFKDALNTSSISEKNIHLDLTKNNSSSYFTSIPEGTFQGCSNLVSIVLPASVTEFKANAFQNCTKLKSLTYSADTAPTIGSNAFAGCNSEFAVECSDTAKTTLRSAYNVSTMTVGDVALTDGTYISVDKYLFAKSVLENKIGGIVTYVETGNNINYGYIAAVAEENYPSYSWANNEAAGYELYLNEIAASWQSGDTDGSDNWTELCNKDATASSDPTQYPAFDYVNNYGNNFTGTAFESDWYLPSIQEIGKAIRCGDFNSSDGFSELEFINTKLTALGYTNISGTFVSSNQCIESSGQTDYQYRYVTHSVNSGNTEFPDKTTANKVCPIRRVEIQ